MLPDRSSVTSRDVAERRPISEAPFAVRPSQNYSWRRTGNINRCHLEEGEKTYWSFVSLCTSEADDSSHFQRGERMDRRVTLFLNGTFHSQQLHQIEEESWRRTCGHRDIFRCDS